MKPLLSLLLLFWFSALSAEEVDTVQHSVDYQLVVDEIRLSGDQAIANYSSDTAMEVGDLFSDLYFDLFEGKGMEQQIAMTDPGLKMELESYFNAVIGHAMREAPRERVEEAWITLRSRLQQTADQQASRVTDNSFTSLLLQSFFILLREGFEAMLVIMALVTYLRRTEPERVNIVWHGVVWALLASLLTAWVMTSIYEVSGAAREALEGVTMLIAAAVLFYVSYWLISKREADRWQQYINGQIDRAVEKGSFYALGFAAFLAVYREGAETVLFYQALALGSSGQTMALLSGFLLALVSLVILFYLMRSATMRLPIGLFFGVTAVLLYYLAFVFVGKGVLELQEARWIAVSPLEWAPQIEWLGLFPTQESLTAQLLFLLPLPVAWWVLTQRRKRAAATDVT